MARTVLLALLAPAAALQVRPSFRPTMTATATAEPFVVSPTSQLGQLAAVTTLSIDTGDLDVIAKFAATGTITDATTNPLFVSQAGLSGDARYVAFVDAAVAYAKANAEGAEAVLELASDRLAVELGLEIVKLVPGYVSTEVDIRASFDTAESLRRARRIIQMYEAEGVDRSRVLIKLAGTWEGIQAARELEKEGITCNITLIFGFIQAVAAAQAGARLISPFPGRIKDWAAANGGSPAYEPKDDPGVVEVSRMYGYFKKHGHEKTICMPASWRPSRSTPADKVAEHAIDEIVALAGVDRMTIPPPLLTQLAETEAPLPRLLEPQAAAASCTEAAVCGGELGESDFRLALNADVCATTKMAEGINAFIGETVKLEAALKAKLELIDPQTAQPAAAAAAAIGGLPVKDAKYSTTESATEAAVGGASIGGFPVKIRAGPEASPEDGAGEAADAADAWARQQEERKAAEAAQQEFRFGWKDTSSPLGRDAKGYGGKYRER